MTTDEGERAARSLALEESYVHQVYEQCADRTVQGKHWPRICEFIDELEPGALVCDIGCGNGKYLDVNHNVFKIGIDRCTKLTQIAREKDNEVLTCDNLSLPFRDESFDAVLSIAVIHHFSTTERRVRAIKELARVLRIGGRIVISVWAMEQKHRKFESQDVLVPWPRAYCISSTGSPMKPRGMSCDDRHRGGKNATYLLSKRGSQRKGGKSYWIDPIFSPSPSTSSLSSPNETCYSFFRRALQKLAGGRRNSRAWFLENWQNGGKRPGEYEDNEDEDVDSLPIELRRLEEGGVTLPSTEKPKLQQQLSDSLSVKSKSLSNIIEAQQHQDLVRSRSSLPGLSSGSMEEEAAAQESLQSNATPPPATTKPRLVKQKGHLNDDFLLDVPENTAIPTLLGSELQESLTVKRAGNVHKQSSMNEELMSIERLKERESVRKNINKQTSLNEDLMYKTRPTLEAFRDTLYSGGARLQLLKSGLTNRIKQSTTNIEKVSGMSIKNGFVRILQSWTSTETTTTTTSSEQQSRSQCSTPASLSSRPSDVERRLSREDGSDSSKDSSLQSDTSVDSEDSFASVIYVPKKNSSPLIEVVPANPLSPVPGLQQLGTASAPPSPRVKYAPDHRLKLMSMSPLVKQFPATSKSLPPPSPPGLSPRTLNSANLKPFFSGSDATPTSASSASLVDRIAEVRRNFEVQTAAKQTNPFLPIVDDHPGSDEGKPTESKGYKSISVEEAEGNDGHEDTSPLITDAIDEALVQLSEKPVVDDRTSRLNQIKELLRQKPDFAKRTRPAFPLVRRASTSATTGSVSKVLPRLMSLELFNPETDDLDSDSSGVSSPESVGSVISVISTKDEGKPRPTSLLDKHISPVESTWSEECKRHLINLTDRLSSESLINDIDQFCRRTKLELDSDQTSSSTRKTSTCKYSDSGLSKRGPAASAPDSSVPDNNKLDSSSVTSDPETKLIQRSCSEDSSDTGSIAEKQRGGKQPPKHNSMESSDIGDSISESITADSSRSRLYSTTSLTTSSSECSRRLQARSSSEETPSRCRHPRLHSRSNGTLSGSSSQESLPSDQINYHQYYHVFREGELDQLIEKYVENLHIISSYYDHASWCVVAEKVQVWTI